MPRFQEKAQLEDLQTLDIRKLKQKGILPYGMACSALTIDDYKIALAITTPNYGGLRHWLLCPWCGCKRTCLYKYHHEWKCRKCLKLLYRSQSYDKRYQAWHQAQKIEARLGEGRSKPKGMHWSTYDLLISDLYEYEEKAINIAMHGLYQRLDKIKPDGRSIFAEVAKNLQNSTIL